MVKERPKSASFLADIIFSAKDLENRPRSTEFSRRPAFPEKVRPGLAQGIKQKKQVEANEPRCCCWRNPRSEYECLLDCDLRSSSLEKRQSELWDHFNHSSRPRRKCRSNPNISGVTSKKTFGSETEFHKVKRSLRLLGFELSDFGIYYDWEENTSRKKPEKKSASFSTKITSRSVSLGCLRTAVKRAWMDDCLDESHRRLLAQAAYEEWYFKKERELWVKRNEERLLELKAKENLRRDFERKKEKSEEEFRKWLHRKKMKRKKNEKTLIHWQENPLRNRLMKTKEESEKAFVKWKKAKEEEIEKKKKEKKKEDEKRLESEKEKHNKKIMAEKAFQQWKTKLKESKILEAAKKLRQKKQEMQEISKRGKEPQISFETWKAIKDEQKQEEMKRTREACRIAREKRQAEVEERMYEAEQAFEDWLEKVELRALKQLSEVNNYNKVIPWIPV